jgi:hypothetical protein
VEVDFAFLGVLKFLKSPIVTKQHTNWTKSGEALTLRVQDVCTSDEAVLASNHKILSANVENTLFRLNTKGNHRHLKQLACEKQPLPSTTPSV